MFQDGKKKALVQKAHNFHFTMTIASMNTTTAMTALFEVAALELYATKVVRTLVPTTSFLEVLADAVVLHSNLFLLAAAAEKGTTCIDATAALALDTGTTTPRTMAVCNNTVSLSLQDDIPQDCLAICLSFLGTAQDRFALQCTCKQFRELSSGPEFRKDVELGGNRSKGMVGIIQDDDTPLSAKSKLEPFAAAGNLEAIHMLGIIDIYCRLSWKSGIEQLKLASGKGYVQSTYALGIALRELKPRAAHGFMLQAAKLGYYPANQDLLRTRALRRRHGMKPKDELLGLMDSQGLNRLLERDHAQFYCSADLYAQQETLVCCNPNCGKWAYGKHRIVCWPVRRKAPKRRLVSCKKRREDSYCSKLCEGVDTLSQGHEKQTLMKRIVQAVKGR